MAANAWTFHNTAKQTEGTTANMSTDTFVMRLYTSASNVNTATLDSPAAATNELPTANGYTSGGQTATSRIYSESGGVVTFDFDDVTWTASGGDITARFAAIINTTTNTIFLSTLLDNAPADATANDGNPFTVQMNASGIYTKS